MSYVIALDQGTTSSRTVLFDEQARIVEIVQEPFEQIFPQPGWVEHDPLDILNTQYGTFAKLMRDNDLTADDIACIGVTNQRETTVLWNRETGMPVYNAIVWQCRRGAPIIEELCSDPDVRARIVEKTGLIPDAYYSASKIKWVLDNVEGTRELAEEGKLAFGTIDTWLIWNLTTGLVHATDVTNASRTMLFNIHEGCWDPWLLELFDIPESILPDVRPSSGDFGVVSSMAFALGVPITGVAGDQQAALFGQCCFSEGQAKNTYGTGCFLLMHTGAEAKPSKNNLVTTIAASVPGTDHLEYALEGSVFVSGALIQWLRDELQIIQTAAETEDIALSVEDSAGVYIVPAFTGMGAPYWDMGARGLICGLTRGAGKAHIVRAALEAIAYQMRDLMACMEDDAGAPISVLNVDGGSAANNFLMQFQSDICDRVISRAENLEATAQGAAFLAGLATGFWKSTEELESFHVQEREFRPQMDADERERLLAGWHAAVKRSLTETIE